VDHVPDPLLLRKSGSAGNRAWDLCVCSQELFDHYTTDAVLAVAHSGEKIIILYLSSATMKITLRLIEQETVRGAKAAGNTQRFCKW
jgi:hypothetical protein